MNNLIKILIFIQDETDGIYKNYLVNEDILIKNKLDIPREDVLDVQINKAVEKIRNSIREKKE